MASAVREINIKEDMPTVDEARRRLISEISLARRQGVRAIKIIHGYGSSGEGGAIKTGVRKSLSLRKKEGKVRAFVFGEEWGIFDEASRLLLDECPELSGDADLNRCNAGITVVML